MEADGLQISASRTRAAAFLMFIVFWLSVSAINGMWGNLPAHRISDFFTSFVPVLVIGGALLLGMWLASLKVPKVIGLLMFGLTIFGLYIVNDSFRMPIDTPIKEMIPLRFLAIVIMISSLLASVLLLLPSARVVERKA